MANKFALPQSERIDSKKQIDRLFRGGGSKAMSAFPLRVVYMLEESEADSHGPQVQMMVSVPKRCFKRAVKRNRVKRQMREAYRLNKHLLDACMTRHPGRRLSMCFIWTADSLHDTADVTRQMVNLLTRLAERV